MPTMKRIPVNGYRGVYFIEGTQIGTGKLERIYYVRYRNRDGKLVEEKAGRSTKDAMTPARAAALRAQRIKGDLPSNEERREAERAAKAAESSRWTVGRLWEEYLAQHPDLKGIKTDRSRYDLHVKDPFGEKEPAEIAPLDVDRLRVSLSKKKAAATTRNVLELLRRILSFGIKRGLCAPLPFRITMPKVNNLKTEDLSPEQLDRLLKVLRGEIKGKDADGKPVELDQDAKDIMLLALSTGLRRGEIFRLKWDDVDFQRGFIAIRAPKGGSDQTIPLSDAARAILEARPHEKTDEGEAITYVFPGRGGRQRKDIKRALAGIREAAGLPDDFRPLHGLRHTFASHLASSGEVDLYTLQRLLTHKSPIMTQRYAHLRDEALKRAANVAGRIIGAPTAKTAEGTGQ